MINISNSNQIENVTQQHNICWQTNGKADLRGKRMIEKRSCKRRS